MALTEERVDAVWAKLMRRWSNERDVTTINKNDLRSAIVGFDQQIDDNTATINGWIPQPARTQLSQAHKLELMTVLLNERRV